jgi:hypothetical protein
VRIAGGRVQKIVPYASESSINKTDVEVDGKHFSYDITKDIAFIYATKPLYGKAGIKYSFTCEVGQKVTIVSWKPFSNTATDAHIIGVNVPLRMGHAELNDNLILDVSVKPGASGSAVIDSEGRLVGIITMYGRIETKLGPLSVSIALPASTVAKALSVIDPRLASAVFGDKRDDQPPRKAITWIDMETSDFESVISTAHQSSQNEALLPDISGLPAPRNDIVEAVQRLRAKAEAGAKSMVNLVATECLITSRQKQRCYEVSITEGEQQYREVGRDGKLGVPVRNPFAKKRPNGSLWAESSWADYLASVTDSTWRFQGLLRDKYIFTGEGRPEDERCSFSEFPVSIPVFQHHYPEWTGPVDCNEVLVTNSHFDVLKIYTEFYPPAHCRIEVLDLVISYQWVKLADIEEPVLLPFEERMTARLRNTKETMTATTSWFDYRRFRTEHRIMF